LRLTVPKSGMDTNSIFQTEAKRPSRRRKGMKLLIPKVLSVAFDG